MLSVSSTQMGFDSHSKESLDLLANDSTVCHRRLALILHHEPDRALHPELVRRLVVLLLLLFNTVGRWRLWRRYERSHGYVQRLDGLLPCPQSASAAALEDLLGALVSIGSCCFSCLTLPLLRSSRDCLSPIVRR